MNEIYIYVKNKFNIDRDEFEKLFENAKIEVKSRLKGTASSHNRIIYFKTFLQNINKNPFKYAEILYNIYWNEFINNMRLYPNVVNVFKYLREHNIKIAICSNLTTNIQIRKIKKLEIEDYIDYLLTSEEIGTEKPEPKIFINIMDYFNISKDEIMFVGDDYYCDIEGANNVGIKSILINSNIKVNGCDSVKNFKDLLKYFK